MSIRLSRLLIATLMVCLNATTALAQTSGTGQISGSVTDPSSAVVPRATVKVVNVDTGVERTTVTTDAGTYAVPLLAPGTYTVTVAAPD